MLGCDLVDFVNLLDFLVVYAVIAKLRCPFPGGGKTVNVILCGFGSDSILTTIKMIQINKIANFLFISLK